MFKREMAKQQISAGDVQIRQRLLTDAAEKNSFVLTNDNTLRVL